MVGFRLSVILVVVGGLTSACDTGPFACGSDAELVIEDAPNARDGELGASRLEGLCASAACSQASPLAVGAHHDFALSVPGVRAAGVTLVSDSPAFSIELSTAPSTVDGRTADAECLKGVRFEGQLRVLAAGTGQLTVRQDGKVIDRYTFAAVDAASASVSSIDDPSRDLEQSGLTIHRRADSQFAGTATVIAQARGADGSPLVLSEASVSWQTSDSEVVRVVGAFDDQPAGPEATLLGLKAGTATVSVLVAGVFVEIPVTVVHDAP